MRPHVAAVYAYARMADDIADEGDVPVALRHQRLDEWLDWLHACRRRARLHPLSAARTVLDDRTAAKAPAIFLALGHTIRRVRPAARRCSRIW